MSIILRTESLVELENHSVACQSQKEARLHQTLRATKHPERIPLKTKCNPSNRRLGRVGEPLGSMSVSKGSSTTSASCSSHQTSEAQTAGEVKVYKDNALKRKLGRVGKPIGTMVSSKKEPELSTREATYADNARNR